MNAPTVLQCRGVLALVFAAALLGACSKTQAPGAPQVPQVSVVTVHPTSVPVTIELPGRTNPYSVAQVRARVDGIVLKRDYKEGADVKAGQRLYQIDPAPYIASLNSAKATLQKRAGEPRCDEGAGRALQDRWWPTTPSASRTTTTPFRRKDRPRPTSLRARLRSTPRRSTSATPPS